MTSTLEVLYELNVGWDSWTPKVTSQNLVTKRATAPDKNQEII